MLVRAIVAIARADGTLADEEMVQVRRIVAFLGLEGAHEQEVEAMLDLAQPTPHLPNESELPEYGARLYVFQQALVMAFADGVIHQNEEKAIQALASAMKLEKGHIETAWRRAKEMVEPE
jgi:uncharacterized membrane protein YebE (DUF533 family)